MRQTAARAVALALALAPACALAAPPPASPAAAAAQDNMTAQRRAIAARAAALAERQAQAAAALRSLETRTAQDTTQLAALQAGQAQAGQQLAQASSALAQLLPAMQRLSAAPAATLLAAPLPPADSVHGIAIMQALAASIATQAQAVRTQSAALAALIVQTQAAKAQLDQAVAAQQSQDARLAAQITAALSAEREDADRIASATVSSLTARHKLDTLNDAVSGLVPLAHAPARLAPASGGAPVAGRIVQNFGSQTLAGPATGVSYGAPPGAVVTTPCAGTVMFAGAFPAYGLLVIADCGNGASVVLAGMARLDVTQGQHLVHGQPVGSMQGFTPSDPTHQPRLYVELRRNGTPVDPTFWLTGRGSG